MMSALRICPANAETPPCPSFCPAASAVVVIVTARVVVSLAKSASVHIKQTRLMFAGELVSEETSLSGPSLTARVAFGACCHVAKDAAITSRTLRLPTMLPPVLGLRFQVTGNELKFQRSMAG